MFLVLPGPLLKVADQPGRRGRIPGQQKQYICLEFIAYVLGKQMG
jgi:hypothetical protein